MGLVLAGWLTRSLLRAWPRNQGLGKDEVAATRHEDCLPDEEDMREADEDEGKGAGGEDRDQGDNDAAGQ